MFGIYLLDSFLLLLLAHILLLFLLLILLILSPDPLICILNFNLTLNFLLNHNLLAVVIFNRIQVLIIFLRCCFCTNQNLSLIVKLHMHLQLLKHILMLFAIKVIV